MSDRLPVPLSAAEEPLASERASASPRARRTAISHEPVELVSATRPHTLSELQAWIVTAISGPFELAPETIVAHGPRLTPRQRLAIYRRGYAARLTACLRDDYPVLAATLGEARFDALAEEYIALHPSSSPSLNEFGRHLSRVCESTNFEAGTFYAELARLEWALVEVTHAEAAVPLDLEALQHVPAHAWGDARLIASDAVRLLSFRYPVNAYYQAYRRDGPSLPVPAPAESATAVYRRDARLWRMELTPAMSRVLSALLAGRTIAEALARIGVREDDPEALAEAERSVMIWFQEWVRSGLFARVVAA